jgi:hypothetical protein
VARAEHYLEPHDHQAKSNDNNFLTLMTDLWLPAIRTETGRMVVRGPLDGQIDLIKRSSREWIADNYHLEKIPNSAGPPNQSQIPIGLPRHAFTHCYCDRSRLMLKVTISRPSGAVSG